MKSHFYKKNLIPDFLSLWTFSASLASERNAGILFEHFKGKLVMLGKMLSISSTIKKNAQKVCRVFFDRRPPLRRWFEWRCHIVSTLRCPPKASLPRRSTTSSSPLQIKMHNLIVIKHCQLRHTLILSQIFLSTFFSYVIWLKFHWLMSILGKHFLSIFSRILR